jgi:MFS family permease
LIALCIYIIGGIGPAIFNATIGQVLICRALLGVGVGLSAPLCGAIINELYSGMEKTNMLGWANAVDSCVGIVLTLIAGYLCTFNWKYTFFCPWFLYNRPLDGILLTTFDACAKSDG